MEGKDKKFQEIIKSTKIERNSNRIVPSPIMDSLETIHPDVRHVYNASNTSSLILPAINENEQLLSKRQAISHIEDPYSPKTLENSDALILD